MNFKDIYKSANDNVCGNRELINSIFEKAENKKSFFAIYYKQISVCAAAVILIMTVSILPVFKENTSLESDVREKIAKVDLNDDKSDLFEIDGIESADKTENDIEESYTTENKIVPDIKPQNKKQDINISTDNKSEVSKTSDKDKKDFGVIPEDASSESKILAFNTKEPLADDLSEDVEVAEDQDAAQNTSIASVMMVQRSGNEAKNFDEESDRTSFASSGGGGGGGSRPATTESYPKTVALTPDEYYSYLGINVSSTFSDLPEGMKLSVPEVIYVSKDSSGRTIDDGVSFTYLDEGKPENVIVVSTTKLGGGQFGDVNSDAVNVIINNISVMICENGNTVSASYKIKDVWFNINSVGISAEDIKNFVTSSIK